MKPRILIAALFSAALAPSAALAAEGGPESAGSWSALVFYIVNFALFAWIIVKYAIPMVRDFFIQRANGIRESMAKAEAAFHEAEDLANRAAERSAKLESEKARIASDLADETVFQVGRIYDLAQETAARIKRDTTLTAAALRENGQRRMRQSLAAAAGRLALERIRHDFQPTDQDRLLAGFVTKLREEAR